MVRGTSRVFLIEGESMIYLDNSATTKPYPEVIESFMKVSTDYFGNPSSFMGWGYRRKNYFQQQESKLLTY